MAAMHTSLRDGWTNDPEYQRCYQTKDDVETILNLLALGSGSALADIGCGNGAFAIAAAGRNPGCRVWAFDALDSAIAECRARAGALPNLHAEVAWAHSIPLASSSADRVLFRSVLHHIAEPQAVYAEFSRLLKTGGRLVLQAPCNVWDDAIGQVLSEMMTLADDSHRRFYYRSADIVKGLQMAGFTTGEPECWPYSYPFVDEKQARFIQQHKAAEPLHLHPIQAGKWAVEGSWVRVVAEKETAYISALRT
jgi:ubiquinone/menaquinone biosynthesis C-methylase UbiE